MTDIPRNIIIIRAGSGSGKSTFASFIQSLYPETVICCADDYFYDNDGNYKFNAAKLGAAHTRCQEKFKKAVDNLEKCIIVANTNTRSSEWKFYENLGRERGYRVTFLILENRHGGQNVHNVPLETLQRQKETILSNISL